VPERVSACCCLPAADERAAAEEAKAQLATAKGRVEQAIAAEVSDSAACTCGESLHHHTLASACHLNS
jgi:hypothetical protein